MDRFIVWALLSIAASTGMMFLNSALGYDTPAGVTMFLYSFLGATLSSLWDWVRR